MVEPEGPQVTSQYGTYALHAGQARVHARTSTRARTRMQARLHTDKYVIFIAFPGQQLLRERASMLRYKYIAHLVIFTAVSVYSLVFIDYF
jgi:hypothetical protein